MGYYVDLVFCDETIKGYNDVVEKFLKQGAKIHDYNDETLPDHIRERYSNFISLVYPDFRYFITVFKKESKDIKGKWAEIRISWGEDPDSFFCLMGKIVTLANLVNGEVYDGQIRCFITDENLEEVKKQFSSTANNISRCFGKVSP